MEKYGINEDLNNGYRAFKAGQSITSCPHTDDQHRAKNWKEGWYEAAEEAKEQQSPQ